MIRNIDFVSRDVFPTEWGPDPDWHGYVETPDFDPAHRSFFLKEEAEEWVYDKMKSRGVFSKGTVAYGTACPPCRKN